MQNPNSGLRLNSYKIDTATLQSSIRQLSDMKSQLQTTISHYKQSQDQLSQENNRLKDQIEMLHKKLSQKMDHKVCQLKIKELSMELSSQIQQTSRYKQLYETQRKNHSQLNNYYERQKQEWKKDHDTIINKYQQRLQSLASEIEEVRTASVLQKQKILANHSNTHAQKYDSQSSKRQYKSPQFKPISSSRNNQMPYQKSTRLSSPSLSNNNKLFTTDSHKGIGINSKNSIKSNNMGNGNMHSRNTIKSNNNMVKYEHDGIQQEEQSHSYESYGGGYFPNSAIKSNPSAQEPTTNNPKNSKDKQSYAFKYNNSKLSSQKVHSSDNKYDPQSDYIYDTQQLIEQSDQYDPYSGGSSIYMAAQNVFKKQKNSHITSNMGTISNNKISQIHDETGNRADREYKITPDWSTTKNMVNTEDTNKGNNNYYSANHISKQNDSTQKQREQYQYSNIQEQNFEASMRKLYFQIKNMGITSKQASMLPQIKKMSKNKSPSAKDIQTFLRNPPLPSQKNAAAIQRNASYLQQQIRKKYGRVTGTFITQHILQKVQEYEAAQKISSQDISISGLTPSKNDNSFGMSSMSPSRHPANFKTQRYQEEYEEDQQDKYNNKRPSIALNIQSSASLYHNY